MENINSIENQFEAEELSHSDKLVGVLSAPIETFKKISQYPSKNIDWALPLLTLIIISVVSLFVIMSKPAIK